MKQFLILCFVVAAFLKPANLRAQQFVLYPVKTNTVQKDYKNILITGVGQSGTRMFLENLAAELSKQLAAKKVKVSFLYLGTAEQSMSLANAVNATDYDGIIHFIQTDKATDPIHEKPIAVPIGSTGKSATAYYTKIRFRQQISMSMYERTDIEHALSESLLKVNMDFTNDNKYKKVIKEIIKELEANLAFGPVEHDK